MSSSRLSLLVFLLLHVEVEVAERLSLTQILRFLRQTDGSSLAPRAASAVSPSPSIWTASSRPEGYPRISAVYTITSTQLNNSFTNQAHVFSTIAFSVEQQRKHGVLGNIKVPVVRCHAQLQAQILREENADSRGKAVHVRNEEAALQQGFEEVHFVLNQLVVQRTEQRTKRQTCIRNSRQDEQLPRKRRFPELHLHLKDSVLDALLRQQRQKQKHLSFWKPNIPHNRVLKGNETLAPIATKPCEPQDAVQQRLLLLEGNVCDGEWNCVPQVFLRRVGEGRPEQHEGHEARGGGEIGERSGDERWREKYWSGRARRIRLSRSVITSSRIEFTWSSVTTSLFFFSSLLAGVVYSAWGWGHYISRSSDTGTRNRSSFSKKAFCFRNTVDHTIITAIYSGLAFQI